MMVRMAITMMMIVISIIMTGHHRAGGHHRRRCRCTRTPCLASLAEQGCQEVLAIQLHTIGGWEDLHHPHHGIHRALRPDPVATLLLLLYLVGLALLAEAPGQATQDCGGCWVDEQQVQHRRHASSNDLLGLSEVHETLRRRRWRGRAVVNRMALDDSDEQLRQEADEFREQRRVLGTPIGGSSNSPDGLHMDVEALVVAKGAEGVTLQEPHDELVGRLKKH